ncbi:MAG: glycosyltransferase [Dermatophilaceae bacterium]
MRKALLVASTGGHLQQIHSFEETFLPHFDEIHYVTFQNAQSRSLLAGRTVWYVPTIPSRGYREAIAMLPEAMRILRHGGYTDVIATGAAIAVPFSVAANLLNIGCHYVESAARAEGPSLAGRLVALTPRTHLYSQYASWADHRWQHRGSVFDRYHAADEVQSAASVRTAVVTLGMIPFPFRRAVDGVRRVLAEVGAADVDVLWQVGDTPTDDLGIAARHTVPSCELEAAVQWADVVFAHAGIGSCLQALNAGRVPVLLPRQKRYGEHVDDHQRMIAAELEARNLAVSSDPDRLDAADVMMAVARRVACSEEPRPFELQAR